MATRSPPTVRGPGFDPGSTVMVVDSACPGPGRLGQERRRLDS
jgi:hypothetical protein